MVLLVELALPFFTPLALVFNPPFQQGAIPKKLRAGTPKQQQIMQVRKKPLSKRTYSQELSKRFVWKGSDL